MLAIYTYFLAINSKTFQTLSESKVIARPRSFPISYFNAYDDDDDDIFYFHTKYHILENIPRPENSACITSDRESFSLSQHQQPKKEPFLNLGGQFFSQK